MAEFFLWSESGDGAFLGRRLQNEGHRVRMYASDLNAKDVYRGIIPLTRSADPTKREVIIFDTVGFGLKAFAYKRRGYKVIGASRFTDSLEINRSQGAQVMKQLGIRIPETYVFRNLNEGIRFLGKQEGYWYYKPSGNLPTYETYDGESSGLARFLEYVKTEPPEQFELQRKVEGTEISLEGWFDGTKWIWPFNSTVEDKKFMEGDKGPRTGCMSNLVWAYEETRPTLALKTVTRIAPMLEQAGYIGPIDLNVVIDKEGEPYGLEWSPRFGYDALQALCLLVQGDFGHQLAEFASGRLDHFETRTDAYALTCNVSVPPYPNHEFARAARGVPVDEQILKDPWMFPRDVMISSNGPVVTGSEASVVVIGAVGTDTFTLTKEIVEKASALKIPNAQYRTDLVSRAGSVLTALSSFMYEGPSVRKVEEPVRPLYEQVPKAPAIPRRVIPGDNSRVVNQVPDMPAVSMDIPTFNE